MRYISRFITLMAFMLIIIPSHAQETTPPAPIDLATLSGGTYTLENITFNYPEGVYITDANSQITIGFDENFMDSIIITTPIAFDLFEIPHFTLDIATRNIYTSFATIMADTRLYEEAVTATTLAGYDAHYFEMQADGYKTYVYTMIVGQHPFAFALNTQEKAQSALINSLVGYNGIADIERALMIGIIETISINGIPILQDGVPVFELTTEPSVGIPVDATAELPSKIAIITPRTAPIEAIELAQAVTFSDVQIQLAVPSDWVIYDEELIITTIQNIPDVADITYPLPEGGILMQLVPPDGVVTIMMPSLDGTMPAPDMDMSEIMKPLSEAFTTFRYDNLAFEAYYMALPTDAGEGDLFVILFRDANGVIMAFLGATADFDMAESQIIAIVSSVVYVP
jgi:hypothetical protein